MSKIIKYINTLFKFIVLLKEQELKSKGLIK